MKYLGENHVVLEVMMLLNHGITLICLGKKKNIDRTML